MDTKLFELHEAYGKHVFRPLKGSAGICDCGFLFYVNTTTPLCGYTNHVLEDDEPHHLKVRDYLKLLKHAIAMKLPRGNSGVTTWDFLANIVEHCLLGHE